MEPKVGDVFIGYNMDTAAAVILQACNSLDSEQLTEEKVCNNFLSKCLQEFIFIFLVATQICIGLHRTTEPLN